MRCGAAFRQGSGEASGGLPRLCKVPDGSGVALGWFQCLHLGWVPEGSGVRVWRSGWVPVGYDVTTRLGCRRGGRIPVRLCRVSVWPPGWIPGRESVAVRLVSAGC